MHKVKSLAACALFAAGLFGGAASAAPVITQNNDANTLADLLIGTGITRVGDASVTGNADQFGTFNNGGTDVGFDTGVVMSSGTATDIGQANNAENTTTAFGGAGDADLDALIPQSTQDAAVLEFDFQFGDGSTGGDLFFSFVFGSEEYLEYVGSNFNDVFGFFVDGVNLAEIGGEPISINNVNNTSNSAFYRDNPVGSAAIDVIFDGLTTVLTISLLDLAPGLHTMKFAIADAGDSILDSGLFIAGGSFSTEPPPTGEIPIPAAFPLFLAGLAGLRFMRRKKAA